MTTKANIQELVIDGETYVPKSSAGTAAAAVNGLQYVVVRGQASGVHIGYLKSREGREVKLINSRRVWYWSGAASLSQLATNGSSKPADCKISVEVLEIDILDAIEVIQVTHNAFVNLNDIKPWKV